MDKVERISKAEKTKGKLKKRNVSKSKKPNAKRQKDSTHLSKQGLVNQENRRTCEDRSAPVVGLSKSKHPAALSSANSNSKMGYLHSSRAKVSETVTARKVLGSLKLHPNIDKSENPGGQLRLDLQRVLGKPGSLSASSNSLTSPAPPSHPLPPPLPSGDANTISVAMEMSPGLVAPDSVAVAEISKRILEGLQVDVIFPDSNYLQNIKAELKKVLKQSNPCGYEELVGYFSAAEPSFPLPPPPLMFAQHFTETMSDVGDHRPDNSLPSAAGSLTPGHVTDLVALNLEINTSALNINDRVSPEEDHSLLRPRDFLDMLDCVPPVGGPHSPPPDWSTTPTRPRLFPHKLH